MKKSFLHRDSIDKKSTSNWRFKPIYCACLLSTLFIDSAFAQKNEAALKLIADTADRICGIVQTSGNAQSIEVKGEVKGQLSGLASKLAELGIGGAGSIKNDSFVGVVQKDLPKTLDELRQCKLLVFKRLEEKLILTEGSQKEPEQKQFSVMGPDVSFGCEEGNTSSVSYNAPPGFKILNSYVEAVDVRSAKFNNPSVKQTSPSSATASVYFHGKDRDWTRNCPGGGHGKVRLHGTIIAE